MKPSEGAKSQQPASDAKPTGEEITVTLKENGKEVKTIAVGRRLPAGASRSSTSRRPKASTPTTVELPRDDTVAQNNAVSFTVSVVEEKINVLLVEGFPRYEFKLIKGVLEVDPLVNLVSISHDSRRRRVRARRAAAQEPRARSDRFAGRPVQVRRRHSPRRRPQLLPRRRRHHRKTAAEHRRVRHQARRRPDRARRARRLSRRRLRETATWPRFCRST